MNPYIVTAQPGCSCDCCPDTRMCCDSLIVTRRAVATLDEIEIPCQKCAWCLEGKDCRFPWIPAPELPESGGTVGPLPDGTVIEVERVTRAKLYRTLPTIVQARFGSWANMRTEQIVAAFNAREASS